jgi:hypothetical protein
MRRAMRAMTSADVKEVVRLLGLAVVDETVSGILICDGARLERGGGIAGNASAWTLVQVAPHWHDGHWCDAHEASPLAWSRRKLIRILLEWAAGERPPKRPGFTLYARRSRNRFGASFIWCYRRSRSRRH